MTRTDREKVAVAGIALVDKPAEWSSHDVVARLRRVLGTRRVGHAGTLDPPATGLLVCGFGRGTRLLGHLAISDKHYEATMRLGQRTTTDDATGEALGAPTPVRARRAAIAAALAEQVGEVAQRPSSVSAIKIGGQRAYKLVRSGADVELKPRTVRIHCLRMEAVREQPDGFVDVDVSVECSSGTYVRAIARDIGEALGCGGHLTRLRRTSVGPFTLDQTGPVDEPVVISLEQACEAFFPSVVLDDDQVAAVGHGRPIRIAPGSTVRHGAECGMVAAFDQSERVIALLEPSGGEGIPKVVFRPAGGC